MLGFGASPVSAITKNNADTEYQKGNYQQAIRDYEELLKNGASAEIYYNLGNAYYRTDNITKAVLNYERARLLSPGDEDINFNELPNQFVLKCTHDSGGLVVCKDKSKLDLKKAKEKIEKSLANNYYLWTREWSYKGVKPRIIAEKYMEDQETGELRDYKFFCFNGEPKLMFVATERGVKNTKFDFYDMQFNHMNIAQHYPNSVSAIKKPEHFEKMIELAKKLSEGFPHVRVDFYEANGRVYFGEMTFYHFGAIVPFETKEWDKKIGDWLVLPEKIS